MSRKKQAIVLVGFIVFVMLVSKFLVPVSDPHVVVKAEPLFHITSGIPFTNSLLVTIIVDVLLIALAVWATMNMKMIPRGIQNIMEATIEMFYKVFQDVNREYIARVFPIIATIFFWVLAANWLGLLPGVGSIGICQESHAEEMEEGQPEGEHEGSFGERLAAIGDQGLWLSAPTEAEEGEESSGGPCPAGTHLVPLFRSPSADLNFTFGLALISFVYIEYLGISAFGTGYFRKFFNTKEGIIMFLVGLLELISEFARILAFAFRLFGNIFAGEVVLVVMAFLIPMVLPLPFYFFEVFVGFIQAFVFAILTMAFISIAVTPHSEEHHGH